MPLLLILVAAVAVRHFVVANTDVSWEITLSEKILNGQKLYSDLIEINPPASTFLYLPAVALARALGWVPETVIDSLVFAAALLSLGVTSRIVGRYRLLDGLDGWPVAAVTLAVLIILPAQTFGEREHIALIAVLPMLATLAARAKGENPLLRYGLVAGIGAGVTVCIKPHFVLVLVFAVAASALHRRSWRMLFVLENVIAATMAVVYGLCVVIFYRAYITEVMPLIADVYLPVRLSLAKTLLDTPVVLWAAAVLIVLGLRRGTGVHPALLVLLTASAGFAAAYMVQGKGWPYQSYPMLALALIALALACGFRRRAAAQTGKRNDLKTAGAWVVLGVIAVWSFAWFNIAVDDRAAAAVVKRVAPPHPSIVLISDDVAVGHPLVRAVQGRWISRFGSLWVTEDAAIQRFGGGLDAAKKQRLAADVDAERQRLIGEIRDGKPDIVLIDERPGRILVGEGGGSWSDWVNADRDLSGLIAANYRRAGSADGVAIYKRNGS